jgi:hypothetical protein
MYELALHQYLVSPSKLFYGVTVSYYQMFLVGCRYMSNSMCHISTAMQQMAGNGCYPTSLIS